MAKEIRESEYLKKYNAEVTKFNAMVTQAKVLNRDNDGQVSKQEAKCYADAAKVCERIIAICFSDYSTREKWEFQKQTCESRAVEILDIIDPVPTSNGGSGTADNRRFNNGNRQYNDNCNGKAVSRTASGFTTANACKDVPAETIEKWHAWDKEINHTFDDVLGMDDIAMKLKQDIESSGYSEANRLLHLQPTKSYLFYGPPGGGKTFLTEAFAKWMKDKGYSCMKLRGSEIRSSLVGVGEKTITIAFKEAIAHAPCVLFIDEMEGVCMDRSLPDLKPMDVAMTNAFLEARNEMVESHANVVFIGATNYPAKVESAMRNIMKSFPVGLPSRDERLLFLKKRFEAVQLEPGFTAEEMADNTYNYGYRDMGKLASDVNEFIRETLRAARTIKAEDGTEDKSATDKAIVEGLKNGEVKITRELFARMVRLNPPDDISTIMEGIEEYEDRLHVLR